MSVVSVVVSSVVVPTLTRHRGAAGAPAFSPAFSPASLFASGERGAWFDPSDMGALFQDAAGTIPVTALGQPVGLMLDKRLGLTPGPVLAATGWTNHNYDTFTPSGGAFTASKAAAGGTAIVYSTNLHPITLWRTYRVEINVSACTMLDYEVLFTAAQNARSTKIRLSGTGVKVGYVTANVASGDFSISVWATRVGEITVDSVSVRELPGNHASQPTATARPTLQARVNLLAGTEALNASPWSNTPGTTGTAPVVTLNAGTAPDGSQTAARLQLAIAGNGDINDRSALGQGVASVPVGGTFSVWLRSYGETPQTVAIRAGAAYGAALTVTPEWQRFSYTTTGATNYASIELRGTFTGTATTADVLVWHPQLELGTVPTPYQRVTTATDYADVGAKRYLAFDGVDDWLSTAAIDFTATDKMTAWTGFRIGGTAAGVVAELSGNANSVDGAFYPVAINDPAAGSLSFGARAVGASDAIQSASPYGVGTALVTTLAIDLAQVTSTAKLVARINGAGGLTQSLSDKADTPGNFASQPLFIGRRNGATVPFTGNLYSLIVRGAQSTAEQVAESETFVNGKTGAY
jgi:hypothetical protein